MRVAESSSIKMKHIHEKVFQGTSNISSQEYQNLSYKNIFSIDSAKLEFEFLGWLKMAT